MTDTTVRGAVATTEGNRGSLAKTTLRTMIEKNRGALDMSLPRGMDADRFARLLLTAANTNPKLFECDPTSFLAAGVQCAQLGLEPNDARGLAYLVPYKDKTRGMVVNLIIGYRGLLDLARRSDRVGAVFAEVVYADDQFDWELGLDPKIAHRRASDSTEDPKTITHAYAVASINGEKQFVVITRRGIDAARAKSMGANSEYSPWAQYYAEMAKKTAVRRLAKMLPLTVEQAQAVDNDERPLHITDLGQITHYVDDEQAAIDASAAEA